jgi:hypothetical protein
VRGRYWSGALAAALVVGNLFLHKSISDLCDALYARIGRGAYERVTLLAIAALCAVGAVLLLRHQIRALRRPRRIAAMLFLVLATVGAQRWLLVSNVELIHLPQFGLIAALLLGAGAGPHAAFLGATAAGVLDETYQHLVIYAHVPGTYFDYNDIVLNTIGVAWAVALAVPGGAAVPRRAVGAGAAGLTLAAVALAVWIAPPRIEALATFPYWQPALSRAMTGFSYHVMPASEGVASCAALWAITVLIVWPDRHGGGTWASVSAAAAVVLALAAAGCAAQAAPRAVEPARVPAAVPIGRADPSEQPFIVTFWCGPPLGQFSDARAAEIAAAGFTVVGAPCEGARTPELNRRALDTAARHGLRLWITDPRVDVYGALPADWRARIGDAVAEYTAYPALGGYFLVDEPSADQFADVGAVVAELQAIDPAHIPYVNLLPDYVSSDALGTPSYHEHLERFMQTVRPPLLSFDYYPFKDGADRESYFDNLLAIRAAALRYRVPFLVIVQAMPHGPYRDPTGAELAWQVHHALAFGARGISYFAYWTPVHVAEADRWHFRHGLVEHGDPTEHFADAAAINRTARAYAAQLTGMRSVAIADSEERFAPGFPLGPLAAVAGAPVTAGAFAGRGAFAILLVNQDYRSARAIALTVRSSRRPELYDPAHDRWQPLPETPLLLTPGGAQLVRWA